MANGPQLKWNGDKSRRFKELSRDSTHGDTLHWRRQYSLRLFLSPKFVQTSRDYLFDLIRQNVSSTYFSGIDFRQQKQVDSTTFRKLLSESLLSSLNRAKHQKNIEIDLPFHLAILKFLSGELLNQFSNVILDGKEYIRKRGEFFERSQQAHVIKARLLEM